MHLAPASLDHDQRSLYVLPQALSTRSVKCVLPVSVRSVLRFLGDPISSILSNAIPPLADPPALRPPTSHTPLKLSLADPPALRPPTSLTPLKLTQPESSPTCCRVRQFIVDHFLYLHLCCNNALVVFPQLQFSLRDLCFTA